LRPQLERRVTPPPPSPKLETDLSVHLFDRVGGRLALTTAGAALLPIAFEMLDLDAREERQAVALLPAHDREPIGPRPRFDNTSIKQETRNRHMNLPTALRSTRVYWIVTGLLCLFIAGGAVFDVAKTADAVKLITGLGYPAA
jgi:hypothetical protein